MGSFGHEMKFFEGHQCSETPVMASRYREKEIQIRAPVKDVTLRKAQGVLLVFLVPGSSPYQSVYILKKVRMVGLHFC